MNRDDIICMAKEADVWVAGQEPYQTQLERFAALVAAAERDACAKVCETIGERLNGGRLSPEFNGCAAAIRARTEA